jgi:hypothetical protein
LSNSRNLTHQLSHGPHVPPAAQISGLLPPASHTAYRDTQRPVRPWEQDGGHESAGRPNAATTLQVSPLSSTTAATTAMMGIRSERRSDFEVIVDLVRTEDRDKLVAKHLDEVS